MRELRVELPVPCGEQWESMAPVGCNRHCESCDKIIHNVDSYRFDELQTMLESGDEVCVRARIKPDGSLMLKTGGLAGRLVAAASLGLLATPAIAAAPQGKIVGEIDTSYWGAQIVATDAAGRAYRTKVRRDGRYSVKKLPPGEYTLTATSCDGDWAVGKVVVEHSEATMPRASEPEEKICIIVGVMRIDRTHG